MTEKVPRTNLAFMHSLLYGTKPSEGPDPEDIKEEAMEEAWRRVVRSRGRDWLLALPELSPPYRHRLEMEEKASEESKKADA